MFGQGLEHHRKGETEEAARIYSQALILNPNLPDIYNNLGVALWSLGKLEASAACYQRSLALRSDHATAYTNLGNVLRDLGRLDVAAASHRRVMILEVMGRDAGHIALVAGIAGAADVILIPEIPYRIEHVVARIRAIYDAGRDFALVVVAESVRNEAGDKIVQKYAGGQSRYGGIAHFLADRLAETTHAEIRATVLGHVQRGAAPGARDRLMASVFGAHAVDLIEQGRFGRMVAWRDRNIVDIAIDEAVAVPATVDIDGPIVRTARSLDICLGDR